MQYQHIGKQQAANQYVDTGEQEAVRYVICNDVAVVLSKPVASTHRFTQQFLEFQEQVVLDTVEMMTKRNGCLMEAIQVTPLLHEYCVKSEQGEQVLVRMQFVIVARPVL